MNLKQKSDPKSITRSLYVKLTVLSICFSSVVFANAQSYRNQPDLVEFIVKSGVNLASLHGKYDQKATGIGYTGGIVLNYGQSKCFLTTGLEYTTLRYKNIIDDVHLQSTIPSFRLPINFGFRSNTDSHSKVLLRTGPFISYGFGASTKAIGSDKEVNTFNKKNGITRFDYGWVLGASYMLDRFVLDAGVNAGITNIEERTQGVTKSLNIAFTLGYKIH